MKRIQSINADRIQWCCNDRGISPTELAAKAGINGDIFLSMLNGEKGLTFIQLRKIADFLNRGVLFFLEPGTVTAEQVHTPQFRTIANQKPQLSAETKSLIERVEKQREVYLSIREDLGEKKDSCFEPPTFSSKTAAGAAQVTRQWLGLTEKNDFTSYRLAVENKGVLVFRSSGYKGQWQIPKDAAVCGFSLYDAVCPIIVIRKASDSRQVFTLMHELGHVLLHKSSFIDEDADLFSYQGKEQEANAFAGHLLVPKSFLDQIDDSYRPNDVSEFDAWLVRFRNDWNVSGEVILRRLKDSGRLQESVYDKYCDWKKQQKFQKKEGGSRKYRYREPNHIFGKQFVRTVLDALHERKITLAKASTYLDNLKIADVHKLEIFHASL